MVFKKKLFSYSSIALLRIFYLILLVACMSFITCALVTYYPTDPSLFFRTNASPVIRNSMGFFGAQSAALLFYLFGGAAYLFVASIVWCGLFFVRDKKLKNVWEKMFAWILVPFCGATLLYNYGVDLYGVQTPGGFFGINVSILLSHIFNSFCVIIFLTTTVTVIFFVIFRRFSLCIAHNILCMVFYLHKQIHDYRIVSNVCTAVRSTFLFFLRQCECFYQCLRRYTQVDLQKNNDNHLQELIILHKKLQAQELNKTHNDIIFDQKNDIIQQTNAHYLENNNQETAHKQNSYTVPSINLFTVIQENEHNEFIERELQVKAELLEKKLERFGVKGSVIAIKQGPVVTLFEYVPHIDTKLSKIVGLEDDLAMALQALSIRIIAPIPGKAVVGFEVANTHRRNVFFSSVLCTKVYINFTGTLPMILGEDTIGNPIVVDLTRMPHLLIAGSTGSGKSVALNAILMSMLCKLSPQQLKLILIDPKRLEFMSYADIPHLLFPIIVDAKKVVSVFRWIVSEMEERYEKMSLQGVRHIFDYNQWVLHTGKAEVLPFIVVIIDELSDLMLTVGRELEDLLTRVTQMARAAGIHLIVATQRPSVDIITGLIKVNFPSRIAFRVTSRIDSRTILDCMGADKLLGRGDMLFLDALNAQLYRVHGAFISTEEIERVVQYIKRQQDPHYLDITHDNTKNDYILSDPDGVLYQQVLSFLQETEDVSISLLQRKFRIGYNRSARIIDMLESHGLIMPLDGSKTRKVIR